jgi:hypothetical protein
MKFINKGKLHIPQNVSTNFNNKLVGLLGLKRIVVISVERLE